MNRFHLRQALVFFLCFLFFLFHFFGWTLFSWGKDYLGRDLWLQWVESSLTSISISILVASGSLVLGLSLAIFIYESPRWLRRSFQYLMDIIVSFPHTLWMIFMALGIRSLGSFLAESSGVRLFELILTLILGLWMGTSRLVLQWIELEKGKSFIQAALGLGASSLRIYRHHILPQYREELQQQWIQLFLSSMLYEGSLSFFGVGLMPPSTSWGIMLQQNWRYFSIAPMSVLLPTVSMMVLVFLLHPSFQSRPSSD